MSTSRKLSRTGARQEYEHDIKAWKRHQRATGNYGQPGAKKPTFEQWCAWKDQQRVIQSVPMHETATSMPSDNVPSLELDGVDPWAE